VGESAVARHDRMVREEMEQAERVRSTADVPADFWQTLAKNFRVPADRSADPTPEALAALIGPDDRVIDVGAGGGRITVPLARRCRELVAVEPSPAMRAVLEEEIARHGVRNIRIVPARWEEAVVEPAALTFAAHVTYGIQAIEPFLRKLDAAALRHAALVTMTDPPQTPLAPFWRAVHGEARLRLPCRDELVAVLRELGADPEVIPLGPAPVLPLGPPAEALDLLRFRMVVGPGTPGDDRLRRAIDRLTEERDGLLWPRGAPPNGRSIIRWDPVHLRARPRCP
jgi:SAM-dependent methyltransferase